MTHSFELSASIGAPVGVSVGASDFVGGVGGMGGATGQPVIDIPDAISSTDAGFAIGPRSQKGVLSEGTQ